MNKEEEKEQIVISVIKSKDSPVIAKAIADCLREIGMESKIEFINYEDEDEFEEDYPSLDFINSFNEIKRRKKIMIRECNDKVEKETEKNIHTS